MKTQNLQLEEGQFDINLIENELYEEFSNIFLSIDDAVILE